MYTVRLFCLDFQIGYKLILNSVINQQEQGIHNYTISLPMRVSDNETFTVQVFCCIVLCEAVLLYSNFRKGTDV